MNKRNILGILSRVSLLLLLLLPFFESSLSGRSGEEYFCYGYRIYNCFWVLLVSLAVIFECINLFIKKRQGLLKVATKRLIKFLTIYVILFIIFTILLASPCVSTYKARNAVQRATLSAIQACQADFFEQESRYANSQAELIEKGCLLQIVVDPVSGLEYTDEDGFGLEGGDNDPKTWSVKTVLETGEYEICASQKTTQFYVCNEKTCEVVEK
jgi:hypothetical protein